MAHPQNLTGAEMAALWLQYQTAANAFEAAIRIKDNGTPETMAAFEEAQQAILHAHTVDLTGIAIKLAVLSESADSTDPISDMVHDLAAAGIVTPRVAV
ncbi:hypothetical protein [Reyranella soli]|uniref:Uncharacterized protein n=1 Tax=Reyranella soli TaxID=1230389 RepID=A0A512NEG9_9HYPH|nr:hypothetical protein [Reyranella soli]GEP57347.1 hypothetical protein RSO01_45130 [Reyranella soli]